MFPLIIGGHVQIVGRVTQKKRTTAFFVEKRDKKEGGLKYFKPPSYVGISY